MKHLTITHEICTQTDHEEVSYTLPLRSKTKLIKLISYTNKLQEIKITVIIRNNKFNLFAQVQPTLTLYRGNTYIFHHPGGHPIRFSTTNDGTHGAGGAAYTTGEVTDTTTPTGQAPGSGGTSTSVTLTASNTNIKVGDVVTATGINTTVAAIDGVSLTLSEAKTIANGTALTFTTSRTLFSPVENTPENMFYYCANHAKMGRQVIILTS